jgi:hypothetical protein
MTKENYIEHYQIERSRKNILLEDENGSYVEMSKVYFKRYILKNDVFISNLILDDNDSMELFKMAERLKDEGYKVYVKVFGMHMVNMLQEIGFILYKVENRMEYTMTIDDI